MNAAFRAFVETEVICKEEDLDVRARQLQALSNMEHEWEFPELFDFCMKIAKEMQSNNPREFYSNVLRSIRKRLGTLTPSIYPIFSNRSSYVLLNWKENGLSNTAIYIQFEEWQQNEKRLPLLPRHWADLGHELGHVLLWFVQQRVKMKSGSVVVFPKMEELVPSSELHYLACINDEESNLRKETLCDMIGLLLLEQAFPLFASNEPFEIIIEREE